MSERKIGVILSYVYTISQVLVNFGNPQLDRVD